MTRVLLRAGFLCLAIVVMIRSAEHFELVPMMGWGPDSPAHYLALTGVALGMASLLAGIIVGLLRWRRPGAR